MVRMIDVFVGLLLVFTTFSLVASAIAEIIESVLRNRAGDLQAGLLRLLGDPAEVKRFYEHPLVTALHKSDGSRPSYIPSETFAVAALNLFAGVNSTTTDLAASLQRLASSDAGPAARALGALGAHSERNLSQWKRSVEAWYDAAMSRLTAVYKRRTQWFLLVLGLFVASALNVDTINIAQTLAADPAMRARVVALAEKTAARPLPASSGVGGAGAVGGADTSATLALAAADTVGQSPAQPAAPSALESFERLQAVGLPIGWVIRGQAGDPRSIPRSGLDLLKKILGILTTAVAITMGAPFWFDVLNRVMNLRAAIKPEAPAAKKA